MEKMPALKEGFRFGVFEVDLEGGELRKSGLKVPIQDQPFQVLTLLLARPGKVVTREEVREKLWPRDTFVEFDRSLNTAVAKLREALSDSADNPRFVETIPRRGYRFLGLVQRLGETVQDELAPGVGGSTTTSWYSGRSTWISVLALAVGAFTSGRELRKVAVQGGDVTKLCQIPEGVFTGGAWAPDGNSIVFTTGLTGRPNRLYELPAQGGSPKLLIEQREPEEGPLSPHFLPIYVGSRILLFSTFSQILLHNLDTGQRRVLGNGLRPVYSPSGHIVFHKAIGRDEIWALPFSLKRSEPAGEAFPVAKDARFPSVARDGTLVYLQPALAERKQLIWRNRDGRKLAEIGQHQKQIFLPSLSPDGRFVGVEGVEATGEDVWIHDVARSTKTRLTQDPARDSRAIWSPDGKEIAFWSNRNGEIEIFTVSTDGQTKPVVIDGKHVRGFPDAWSPDGHYLAYGGSPTKATWDRDLCLLERKPNSQGWAKSTSWQSLAKAASFSPDGRFLAYCSAESGRLEVYVRPFPEGPGKWHVSTNGGTQPRWRSDGKELFYVEGDTLIAASVSTTPTFSIGGPVRLFSDPELDWQFSHPTYDVSADGQRFVLTEPSGTVRNATIQVVQNWIAEFKR